MANTGVSNDGIAHKKGIMNLENELSLGTKEFLNNTVKNRYLCNIPGIFNGMIGQETMMSMIIGITCDPEYNLNVFSIMKKL